MQWYEKNLNAFILLALILGAFVGIFLPELAQSFQLLGKLFIALLKMIVVPLVFASIFIAIAGLGSLELLKRIGIKTLLLYLLSTALSVLLAIVVMNIVHIGEPLEVHQAFKSHVAPFSIEAMIMGFIPTNIFASLSQGNMMQIIIFSALLGGFSYAIKPAQQRTLVELFNAINDIMLVLARTIILLTPFGVFSLIAVVVAQQGVDVILNLYGYVLTVIAVIVMHALMTLPMLLFLLAKINPYRYLHQVKEASLMAFSTASSAATLPVSMRVVQHKGGVKECNAAFVLPLGATVSMDGTAAYLTIAVLYIANLSGVTLGLGEQLLMGVTVVALSVGVAALPSASLVMMVVILDQLGLDAGYIAVIVAVDRLLDMFRTSLNVTSDLCMSKIVDETTKTDE